MPNCTVCGRTMKPLFTGYYCPADCDRAPQRVEHEITQRINVGWSSLGTTVPPSAWPAVTCPRCHVSRVQPFAPGSNVRVGSYHCLMCGHVFVPQKKSPP